MIIAVLTRLRVTDTLWHRSTEPSESHMYRATRFVRNLVLFSDTASYQSYKDLARQPPFFSLNFIQAMNASLNLNTCIFIIQL